MTLVKKKRKKYYNDISNNLIYIRCETSRIVIELYISTIHNSIFGIINYINWYCSNKCLPTMNNFFQIIIDKLPNMNSGTRVKVINHDPGPTVSVTNRFPAVMIFPLRINYSRGVIFYNLTASSTAINTTSTEPLYFLILNQTNTSRHNTLN